MAILDADAERLSTEETVLRISNIGALVVLFVVYGQNPNSGTTGMAEVERIVKFLSEGEIPSIVGVVGSHASALPKRVLSIQGVDFVLLNEGVYVLHTLLSMGSRVDFSKIKGLGYSISAPAVDQAILNMPERVVPQERMDVDLPGYA